MNIAADSSPPNFMSRDAFHVMGAAVLLMDCAAAAGYQAAWQLGADDSGLPPFSQESSGPNSSPGSASVKDDDYYFAGTYPAPVGVVGTDDPLYYVRRVTVAATLVTGTVTVATIPLFSATKSSVQLQLVTPNTTTLTTSYSTPTLTPGKIGTASIVARANVAAGTINAADVSTLALTVQN